MVMQELFGGIYKNKKVLVTGHTGFKGSWLSLWLKELDAKVIGYALQPNTQPNHFELLDIDMISIIGDITDYDRLYQVFQEYQPDIVFHLAAQPLVRYSYANPVETFQTNVMGTVNVFEACKNTKSVKAIVNITSDKCYDNKEQIWGYRETDSMGGYDPYSASKGCAELVTSSYRNSFFNPDDYHIKHNTLLASCRAGNVIGGGDWAEDRLIPDIIRAIEKNEIVKIRNPHATRPWQHVLEPLSGYLLVGQKLLQGEKEFATAWNFGPKEESDITVEEVVKNIKKYWNRFTYDIQKNDADPHEAHLLKLDCTKAAIKLHWMPEWNSDITFEKTIKWYKEFYENNKIISLNHIYEYTKEEAAHQ